MKRFFFFSAFLIGGHTVIWGQTANLSGVVFDANGSVIVGAHVVAVDSNKKAYETRTNSNGVYEIRLPFNKYDTTSKDFDSRKFKIATYDIIAKAEHFQQIVISGFKIVPAHAGKIKLDLALDVQGTDLCHDPTACIHGPIDPIEKGQIFVPSSKISARPKIEEIIKETKTN